MIEETAARRIYALMVMTAWADGHVHAAEATAIREIGTVIPDLAGLGDRAELLQSVKERIDRKGLDAAVREIAVGLIARPDREIAFRCCAKVLEADGKVEAEEAEVLAALQEMFGFTGADVQRLLHRLEE